MYATTQDIVDLHGADFLLMVAARGNDVSLADDMTAAAINDALGDATSECDTYLATRYMVPIAPVPRIIRNHTINMAVYHLASTADRMTEIIRERYKNAVNYLKDIAAGRANLPLGDAGVGDGSTSQAAPELVSIESNDAQFKRGGW